VADPDSELPEAAWPKVAPVAAQIEAPAACVDRRVTDNVPENGTNSQGTAFETWVSEQPWNTPGSAETDLRELVHQAMANSRLAKSRSGRRELPANGRESLGRAH
jgi:hypothetical protein